MLKVHLEPADVTAVPGSAVVITAVVTNEGDTERTCHLRVVGLEAPWVEHSTGALTVPAGSRLEIPIRVTLPHGFPRGETLVGVEVQADGTDRPLVADARLAVSDLESLSIGLSPVTVRGGWRGRFKLNIQNRGTEPLTITLSGRGTGPEDSKSDLEFHFQPEELTLRAGERVKTKGFVSARRHLFGNPRRRALTVTAQGQTAPRHVQGAFVQRPLMPRNILRVIGLVLVLAMWAGALTTGVRLTSKSSKATAEKAAATADAGGAGGADGKGGAGGGPSGSGSQEDVAPATGGAIAGQVKGPQDPSGITVAVRPVALADDLGEDITLISASAGDDPTKESAQTLRREPAGPVGPTATTTTDGDGRWAFGGLKSPANYELTFSKAGFAERTYIVTVNDETPSVALDVSMTPGNGALSGTVKTADGPLGGAVVTVTDGTVTFKTTTPTSGDVGAWSVDGLTTPGTYVVSASLRGYGTESTSVSLGSGDSESGVDLTMAPGVGSITGHVTGAGTKLGNITVAATNGDVTRTATTLTEGDPGFFSLPQLPIPGTYTVSVSGDGWIAQTMSLDLKGNASKVDLDLVRTTATIVGTIKDSAGKELASTGVTLAQDKPIVKTLSAVDPAGSYELTGLAPGTYTLTFERADFKTESAIVTVAAGERKTVDQTLAAQVGDKVPKDAVVRGIVRSSTTGNPVAGVQVTTNATTVTTDATGGFTFDKLAPGSYDLAFSQASYQPATRTVRIGAKSDTTIDVTMLTLGGIQGVVSDLTATPIANVTVTVTNDPSATGQAAFNMATTTDSSGQFSLLEKLQTGKYIATFTKAGYETRARNFDASAGTVSTGDTTLIELGAVFGTIQEPNSAVSGGFVALTGATVSLTDLSNNPITDPAVSIAVDNPVAGQYTIIGLSPGDYKVVVSKALYQTVTKTLTGIKLRETRDGSVVLNGDRLAMSGKVTTTDANGNSAPIGGAQISATIVTGYITLTVFPYIQPTTTTLSLTTLGDGTWSIPAASGPVTNTTGSYVVSATGYTTRNIAISAPDNNADGQVVLTAVPRAVSGGVKLAGSSGGGTTTVTVTLSGAGLSSPRTLTPDVSNDNTTVATYNFNSPKVPVGTYNLAFTAVGFDPLSVPITVLSTGDLVVPDQTLNKLGSIVVTATSGSAVSGASVDLKKNGVVVSTLTTDVNGQVTFPNLAPSSPSVTYTVSISKTGYAPDTNVAATVTPGTATAHNRTLAKWSTLTVQLKSSLDGVETVLSGATVQLVSVDGFGNPAALTNVPEIGSTGDYTLPSVAPNPAGYTLSASATGHTSGSTTIFPVAGTAATPALALLANPKIKVHLLSHQGSTDTPLAGGTVTATPLSGGGSAVSAADIGSGDYRTTNVPQVSYRIDGSAAGHAAGLIASVSTAPGVTATPTLSLDKYPSISVTVDKQVNGVTSKLTGATSVFLVDDGTTSPIRGTLTESPAGSGTYVITGATPGTYDVYVNEAGYLAASSTGSITTVAGQADQTATAMTVNQLATVSVQVNEQVNGGAPTPFSGTVILTAPGTTATALATFTETTPGNYTVAPQPGTYDVVAKPTGYAMAVDTGGNKVVTTAGGANQTAAPLLVKKWPDVTVSVRSHVASIVTDANLSGATVVLALAGDDPATNPAATLTTETTPGSGDYKTSTPLAPGTYSVYVSAPGHDSKSSLSGVVTVAGEANQSITLSLDKRPDLQVTAVGRVTVGSPSVDTDSALTNGTVTATCTAGSCMTPTVDTVPLDHQGAGVYRAAALRPGTYTVSLTAKGYVSSSKSVTITAAGPQVSLDPVSNPETILAAKDGQITGTVRKLDGAVLSGVTVTAISNGQVATAITNGSGVYTLTGVQPVSWTVSYRLSGYSSLVQTVTVPTGPAPDTGGTATVNTVLAELGATLTGKTLGIFTDAVTTGTAGNPIFALDAVQVSLTGAATRTQTVTPDGNGNYVWGFSDLPTGTYQLSMSRAGYDTHPVTDFHLDPAQVVARTDTLEASTSTANFTVVDSVTPATKLAGVVLTISGTRLLSDITTVATDANGLTSATPLPPGDYTVTFDTVTNHYATPVPAALSITVGGGAVAVPTITLDRLGKLDVTLSGLLNSDTADVTIMNGATQVGTATYGNTTHTFDDLPLGVVLTVNAVNANYTFPASPTVTLTAAQYKTDLATIVASPKPGSITVTVNGLLAADTATADLTWTGQVGGALQVTNLVDGVGQTTAATIPAGVNVLVHITASKYDLNSSGDQTVNLTAGQLGAGASFTATPKNGRLLVSVSGLVNGDEAKVAVSWVGGSIAAQTTTAGSLTIANVPADKDLTVTVSSMAKYTVPAPFAVTKLGAAEDRAVPITVTPDNGSIDVTVAGDVTVADTVTAIATWAGGSSQATRSGTGLVTIPDVKPGVAVTVSVAATGFHSDGDVAVAALNAGQLHKSAGTVTMTLGP